jgi:hypothetical protein
MEEFSKGTIKISIALLLLFLISLIRYSPKAHVLGKTLKDEFLPREPELGLSRPQRNPTPEFLEFYWSQQNLRVDSKDGSWCLQSLPLISKDSLHETFERMPFEQAVQSLKAMRKEYREDVSRRLDLHPALRERLN